MTMATLRNARTILVVGGTFDPPHTAHLVQPLRAAEAIGADALAYIPAGRQPLKDDQPQSAPQHRLAMVRLMVGLCAQASVLTLEVDRLQVDGRPSYMVDTLTALREALSVEGRSCPTLRLLIGSDQAASFHRWHQPARVIELAEPVVMPRPPWTHEALMARILAKQPAGEAARWPGRLVDLPQLDISSTHIRQRVREGRPIAGLVAPEVADYIHQNHLYLT